MKSAFDKIISNTFFNFAGWLLTAFSSFITAPLIIKNLGFELYGLWATFFICIGILNLLDLGFGTVLIRDVAALSRQERRRQLGSFINLAFIYYALVFIFSGVFFYFAWQSTAELLNIDPVFWPIVRPLFRLAGVYFLLERIHLLFVAIFTGLQKMYFATAGTALATFGFLAGTIWLMAAGQGLISLAWMLIASYILVLIYDVFTLGRIKYDGFCWVWPKVKQLKHFLSFGFQVQLTIALDQFNIQAFKLLVSMLFGLQTLAFYELAFRLVAFLQSLTKLVLPAVFPAAAELAVREDKEQIFNLTRKGTRYLIVLTGLFYVGAMFLANDFFLFWLKQDLPLAVWAVRLLLIGYFGNTIVGIMAVVLMSTKYVVTQLKYISLFAGFNLAFGLILGKLLGFKPMLFSLSLAAMIALPILSAGFRVKIKAMPAAFWRLNVGKTLLAALASGLLIYGLGLILPAPSLTLFIAKGTVFVFGYVACLFLLRFFTIEDKIVLERLLELTKGRFFLILNKERKMKHE